MAKYILKQAAVFTLINEANTHSNPVKRAYTRAAAIIEQIAAEDVQSVVHAYWIELPKALNTNENPCKCSNCGHILSFMNGYPKSKYCDECGAKMDTIYEDDKVRAIKVTGWDNYYGECDVKMDGDVK